MSRLTYNKPNGEWGIEGVDLSALPPKVYGAVAKLKDIESGRYPDVASTELALRTLADDVAAPPAPGAAVSTAAICWGARCCSRPPGC